MRGRYEKTGNGVGTGERPAWGRRVEGGRGALGKGETWARKFGESVPEEPYFPWSWAARPPTVREDKDAMGPDVKVQGLRDCYGTGTVLRGG